MRPKKATTSTTLTCLALLTCSAIVRGQSNTAVADSAVSIGFQTSGGSVVSAGVGISFQSGAISVTTNNANATFTIVGPVTYTGGGPAFSQPNAAPGQYTITFGAVTGYNTPGQQTQTLSIGGTIGFTGSYTSALPPSSSIGVTPASLAFWCQQGASAPSPQNVTVFSSGPLTFTAAPSTSGSGGAWLSVSPTGGTTGTSSAILGVSVAPQNLKAGAYSGQITISSTEPPVVLPVVLTVTPSTPVERPMALTGISGWYAPAKGASVGKYVKNAQWQGQPNVGQKGGPPNAGQYYLYYAIDACEASSPCTGESSGQSSPTSIKEQVQWVLHGNGFCAPTGCQETGSGSVVFSDPSNPQLAGFIAPAVVKAINWTADTITFEPTFAPNVFFQYTDDPTVLVTLTAPDGAISASIRLPAPDCTVPACGVVSTIATRGYGQCTWFVANQRLAQGLPIPYPSAYENNTILPSNDTSCGSSDQCYIPQQWDVIDFDSAHTAIIISPVITTPTPQSDGNTLITYSFTVGEMNVGICSTQVPAKVPPGLTCKVPPLGQCGKCEWSEQSSTTQSTFEVLKSPAGTQTLKKGILSFYSRTAVATGYFR